MNRTVLFGLGITIALCSTPALATPAATREDRVDLDFEARVRAQAAIERVYHGHRIDSGEFDAAVPLEVLEEKVRRFLRQSNALERQWKTRVTGRMLDRELARMVRDSRDSKRLRELFDALGNDPVLIRECLARPILVDRLVRNFFNGDRVLHADARREAERIHAGLIAGSVDPLADHPRRTVRGRLTLEREAEGLWVAGDVVEHATAYRLQVVLAEEPDRTSVAVYSVPRRQYADWVRGFDALPVSTVAEDDALPQTPGNREDCGDIFWDPTVEQPSPRSGHVAVWTGSEMIVWGGRFASNTGGRYDPATDTWSRMSTLDAPDEIRSFTAVWTGSEMIVWGGYGDSYLDTGARYNPASDSWDTIQTQGAPGARAEHSAVWTGTEMIVWGGSGDGSPGYLDTGGRYNPATDLWTLTSMTDAPAARDRHTAIWTGTRMIVWGGAVADSNIGGLYDPSTDNWTPTTLIDAPVLRYDHSAVWTGDKMIVWGGSGQGTVPLSTGGRYDPASNKWTPTSNAGSPDARTEHSAIWTGTEMLVWSGEGDTGYFDTGGSYDPTTDSWRTMPAVGAPVGRTGHTAVWTGDLMIVWGGLRQYGATVYDDGGRYDPVTRSWTPTSLVDVWEPAVYGHSIVWTGNEMIVWGGTVDAGTRRPGSVYNPTTGLRTPTSGIGAPYARGFHSAVWTGTEMIVWGGTGGSTFMSGGRYDPVADSWTATTTLGAPSARTRHTAVWTGSEMIVWGGGASPYGSTHYGDGGRYDPISGFWSPISVQGAPSSRLDHLAVWTGTEMLVCAGIVENGSATGGRYHPDTDTWQLMTENGSVGQREGSTAVWTGREMIVWGGVHGYGPVDSGGRYDPVTDTWTATPILPETPARRWTHSAVWTGAEMIVWGGWAVVDGSYEFVETGGRYRPPHLWTPTPTIGAPAGRARHEAVWTGNEMIVWGGHWSNSLYEHPDTRAGFLEIEDPDQDGLCGEDDCEEGNPYCGTDCTDVDGDGYCVPHDCDVSNPFCTTNCADNDSDGYCVTHDCDDFVAGCATNCTDADGDGLAACAGDCDESNPHCTTDCTDADLDGYCVTDDCDDSFADCTVDCSDADGDGLRLCDGDCDDLNPHCTTDCTDLDGDGYCVTTDCDDGNAQCTIDCTDADLDGFCLFVDCDDSVAACTTDCTDNDEDGVRACDGDCDEWNPNCTLDCTDADADGYCLLHDCDESNPNCRADCTDADADSYCVNLDCDDSVASCTIDCGDPDGDGHRGCDTDCDEGNPHCSTDCTDADSDGYCVTSDCDESNPACTSDCTDGDSDGFCITSDCDDSNPGCTGTDCSDTDGDGVRVCEDDCDDHNANCTSDCTDVDADGFCVTTDCDDSRQFCTVDCTDADSDDYCVTFDCDETLPDCGPDCSDLDGDGLAVCAGDCDDTNPLVLPGLDEICTDDADNDCNGLTDATDAACSGLVASGLGFTGKETLVWTGATAADGHGLYRGTIPATGMTGYDHLCEATELSAATAVDPDLPGLGRGFYYLVAGQSVDLPGDRFTGGPLGSASTGASRPTSETITCGPRVFVDVDAVAETRDGLSWATAYSSVGVALNHEPYRDRGLEVWVHGSVTETSVQFPEVLRPGVRLLGGFAGTEDVSWVRSPELSPTIWSGAENSLLFRASGTSVVLDGLTMRMADACFVADPAGRWTELTDVTMQQIGGRALDLVVRDPGESKLFVHDSTFDSAGLGAIRISSTAGLLTGEIRGNEFSNWTDAALRLETLPQSVAEIRLDIVSNSITGGGDGIVLKAHVDDVAAAAIHSSLIGSNLIHGTGGNALTLEAGGYFDFTDVPARVDASPLVVGNTFVDGGGDGVACVVSRTDLTVVPYLHTVRAAPQLWDNLITHNGGAGISETPDDPGTNLIADPLAVGNGLFGNMSLYRDEGTTDLAGIEDVNSLAGARDNFDEDPRYRDRATQDYRLAFGTVLGFKSTMRYLANETDPGIGLLWTQPGFDDSTWRKGVYGVGFDTWSGPNAAALLLTKVSPATISVYTLLPFTVDDLGEVNTLILGADYDDGFAAWINGVEVFRSATVPAGPLDWNSAVSLHESSNGLTPTYEEYDISATGVPMLVEGQNLLAVAVWTGTESSDMVLVPRLILQQESPAVDTGHPEAPRIPSEDIDGERRGADGDRDGVVRPDVGADERW